jgi:glucose-1-phosphate thymidylyltransferase
MLILGDNIFYGDGFTDQLSTISDITGGKVFGYKVEDPQRYGVVGFDDGGRVTSIVERPSTPPVTTQ